MNCFTLAMKSGIDCRGGEGSKNPKLNLKKDDLWHYYYAAKDSLNKLLFKEADRLMPWKSKCPSWVRIEFVTEHGLHG